MKFSNNYILVSAELIHNLKKMYHYFLNLGCTKRTYYIDERLNVQFPKNTKKIRIKKLIKSRKKNQKDTI